MTDGEPKTVVSDSLHKIKLIKYPIQHFFKLFISLNLKQVTHLSIISMVILYTLKTLDFYFKGQMTKGAEKFRTLTLNLSQNPESH